MGHAGRNNSRQTYSHKGRHTQDYTDTGRFRQAYISKTLKHTPKETQTDRQPIEITFLGSSSAATKGGAFSGVTNYPNTSHSTQLDLPNGIKWA